MTSGFGVFPFSSFAAVCETFRPDWDGQTVTALSETMSLISSPLAIALLLASAIAIRFRSQWGSLVIVVLWTVIVSLITMADPTGQRDLAMAEGCVGPASLFIGLVAAICVGMILYTMPRETRL